MFVFYNLFSVIFVIFIINDITRVTFALVSAVVTAIAFIFGAITPVITIIARSRFFFTVIQYHGTVPTKK